MDRSLSKTFVVYQTKWHLAATPATYGGNPIIDMDIYDYGLRWYHPDQGRFVNRDPIGEAGGENLYAFVNNDPVNGRDMLGLFELCPEGGGNPDDPNCGDHVDYELDPFSVNWDGWDWDYFNDWEIDDDWRNDNWFENFYYFDGSSNIFVFPLAQREQLSKEDCNRIASQRDSLRAENQSIQNRLGQLRRNHERTPLISFAGHAADIGTVFAGIGAARVAGRAASRRFRAVDRELTDHLESVTRRAGVLATGMEVGVTGNLDNALGNIPLSFGSASEMVIDNLSEKWHNEGDELTGQSNLNSQKIRRLNREWKEGDCERFNAGN